MHTEETATDIADKMFGFWKVLYRDESSTRHPHWFCQCTSCGKIKSIRGHSLTSGDSTRCKSCQGRFQSGVDHPNWKGGCKTKGSEAYFNAKLSVARIQCAELGYSPPDTNGKALAELWAASDNKCQISGEQFETYKDCALDHCHESGKIRGFVKNRYNTALGLFHDSPELLRAAADYLERTNEPSNT